MNIDDIRTVLNNLVSGIAKGVIVAPIPNVPKFWQLYLEAPRQFSEVDTCATSHCLSILAKANYCDDDLISNAVASVIRLRNDEGSWPSAITPRELAKPETRMQGDTAIGDNCFALTALIDVGFLNENFRYSSMLSADFKHLFYRVQYVFQAVKWLLNNKASDGWGWYYTNNKDNEHVSVVLTTLNVSQVFAQIVWCLNDLCSRNQLNGKQQNECRQYILKLNEELESIIARIIAPNNIWFNIQNNWKAIGTVIGSNEPSIIHTCKLVNLILYNKSHNGICVGYDILQNLTSYIIDNTRMLDNWDDTFSGFYFENYQLNKLNEVGLPIDPILVDHENLAEGIILGTLVNLSLNEISVEGKIIDAMLTALFKRMDNVAPNFCRCRSTRKQDKNWWHPVYASYEAYMALKSYTDNYNIIYPAICAQESLTIEDAIDFRKVLNAQIIMLKEYQNNPAYIANPITYGSSIKECGKLIERLEKMLVILRDSNYIDLQNSYNVNLLPKIKEILE